MSAVRCGCALLILGLLAGCANRPGCTGEACKRPDSTNRALVIWWPEEMRQGLNEYDRDRTRDYSVIPLED
ncbi:HrpT family type III secretion system protein [Pseudomonas sp. LRF_L74]|uniref:HrpT family type III secretion system protein n=1 Tax=Pseudomonas sp. LRF_L74 TaxID=3369422 RepID=UPI003F5EB405